MNALFTTILNMSIAGAVVIAVILIGRLLLRNAPKKWSYLLWIAAAFRLCCPVSIRSAISLFRVIPQTETAKAAAAAGETASRLSYIPAAVNAPAPTAVPALPSAMPIAQTTGLPSAATAAPAITSAPVSAAPVTAAPITANPVAGAITNEAANTAAQSASVSPLQIVMTVLTVLWLAGIAALVIYAIVDYLRLRKNVAAATKLAGEKNVFQSENITSPFIIGIFRPRIMVPYGLTEKELQYVLAHERYHLRRGDQIIKLFSFLLLCLHWFNPLCWLAFILMSRDMEMSCDEKVLSRGGNKAGYSSALLSFAAGKRYPAPNPLSFSETNIKGRVKNAMKFKKPKLIVTIVAVMLCIAIVAACGTNPAEKQDKNDPAAVPEGYDEHDYSLLRDYFELCDENGVRNGDKLFAAYDPADPESWYGVPEYSEEASALEWKADGGNKKLARLVLCGPIAQPVSLAGKLELRDLTELAEFKFEEISLEELFVSGCRKLETGVMYGSSVVRGEAELTIPVLGHFGVSSDTSVLLTCLPCSVNGVEFDFTVELLAEGGRVGFNSGAEGFMLAAEAIDRSMYCTGWTDENDAVVCDAPHFIPYEGQTEFKGDFSYMPIYEKASPGNTDNVRIVHRESQLHSEEDISAAIEIILDEFRTNWWGCILEKIGYAGDGTIARYKPCSPWEELPDEDIMYLVSDFRTGPDCPDISLGTDTAYPNWSWILIRNEEGQWEFVDCGYGVDTDAQLEAETIAYWPVDIDGDGAEDKLAIDLTVLFTERYEAPYIVLADGTEVTGFEKISPAHAGVGTYAIAERDGRQYVLEHHIQSYSGGHVTDRYVLWTLENGSLAAAETDAIEYNFAYSMDRNTNDVGAVIAYYDKLNEICSTARIAISVDPFITCNWLFRDGDLSKPLAAGGNTLDCVLSGNLEAIHEAVDETGNPDYQGLMAYDGTIRYLFDLGQELDGVLGGESGYDRGWDLEEKLRFNNHVIERYWDYVEIMLYLGYEDASTIELLGETQDADGVWTYVFHDSATGKTYSIVGGDPATITEISWTFE